MQQAGGRGGHLAPLAAHMYKIKQGAGGLPSLLLSPTPSPFVSLPTPHYKHHIQSTPPPPSTPCSYMIHMTHTTHTTHMSHMASPGPWPHMATIVCNHHATSLDSPDQRQRIRQGHAPPQQQVRHHKGNAAGLALAAVHKHAPAAHAPATALAFGHLHAPCPHHPSPHCHHGRTASPPRHNGRTITATQSSHNPHMWQHWTG